ncbi:hypothetical protein ACOMHN_064925 [Nucella lapillus]
MAAVSGGNNMNYLSAPTIRLLGSTQVIASVYSVVKELTENSLDAGAKAIEIKLENYGLDKIEVRDNGRGIHTSDIIVLAKRHFTSKITSHADLETLASYGFRGEALASLCAVSEVMVTTKTEAEDISQTYTLNSEGDVTGTMPSHLGQGTTVCAKHLFKHLPVRKQYHNSAKKKKEDVKNVENLLLSYSVILPGVRFSLRHNKEVVWQKAVLENSGAVLQMILGKSVTQQMEWNRRQVDEPQMQLELCSPKAGSDVSSLSRSTADRSFLCVNGRPVVVKEIDKLIRQYYNNCHACETSRYPVYYMRVTLPSKDLDVNLDPNKTSVMATSMPTLLEQLEEMLLYIYGPLDQAPSWKYRDREEGGGTDKPSTSKSDTDSSFSVLKRWRKTSSDEDHNLQNSELKNNNVTEKENREKPLPSSTDHEAVQSVQRQEADYTSAKNENEGCKVTPEANTCSSGKNTGLDAIQEEQGFKNSRGREQEAKQSSNGDDCNSNTLKDGSGGRPSSSVPQGREERSESASELQKNDTVDKVEERDVENNGGVCEGIRDVQRANISAGNGQVSSEASKKTDEESGSSAWSHGTSIRSGDGTVAQKLSPAKSTLYDMINNTAVKRPLLARDFFFKDKRSVVVEQNPDADYDQVTDILGTMWDELPEESSVTFREKCWYDTQRYDKEVAAAKNVTTGKIKAGASGKAKAPLSVRDMVAASSTQPSPGKLLKKKTLPSVPITDVDFSMVNLKDSLQSENSLREVYFKEPQVLGALLSGQAWVCGRGKELCVLNAHRLSEAMVFHRLVNQHRLPVHHCQPVSLTASNTGGLWTTVETLAGSASSSADVFSHLTDCRITHNGFDVKHWRDGDGQVCAELVAVCGDVPTYGLKDLVEVLGLIERQSSSSSLAQARPLKVLNYLKGEAVRMVRQQAGERSAGDIQDLVEESGGVLPPTCHTCLHGRPFFHRLLPDLHSALLAPHCAHTPPHVEDGGGEGVGVEEGGGVGVEDIAMAGGGRDLRSDDKSGDGGEFDQMLSLDDLMDFND